VTVLAGPIGVGQVDDRRADSRRSRMRSIADRRPRLKRIRENPQRGCVGFPMRTRARGGTLS
jgi:hypothetical protein